MKKRISLIVMVLIMVVSIIPMFAIESEAATTYDFLWPVRGGNVSGYFSNSHDGIDIVTGDTGDDTIYAARAGKVIWNPNVCQHINDYYLTECTHFETYGNAIAIQHSDGTVAYYGHLKYNSMKVAYGQTVTAGQPLATMGSSGKSSGKHLHFEVRLSNNTRINVNPVSKGGAANYSYSGYNGEPEITYATIAEGTYYFNNDGYRMYMKNDTYTNGNNESVKNTLGASNATPNNNYKFVVTGENYYKIYPEQGKNGYVVNCFWGFGSNGPTSAGQQITLFASDGDASQRFEFEAYGSGYLIHPKGIPSLSWTREGDKIVLRSSTKAANQIWVLEDATECSHTYGTTFVSNGTHHWKECTKCGDETEKEAHIYDNDCDAYCNGCGRKRTVTHTYGATLKSDGTHHWKECTECGDQIQKATHSYDNDCDAYCNGCGRERTVTHTYGATLESNGTHHWKACTKCGAEVEKAAHSYDNACDATCNVCSRERTVAPHSYSATKHDGYTLYTCSVCGDNYKEFHTPEREECQTHSYDEGVVTKKATCTEVGKRKKTCSACGHTVTEDIPKTDHNFGEWFTSGSSDDTEIKHRDCKTCGEYEIKEIEKENTAKSGSIRDWLFDNTEVLLIVCCGVVVVSLLGVAIFKKRK